MSNSTAITDRYEVYRFVCVLSASLAAASNAPLLVYLLWFKALRETQNVVTFHLVLSSLGIAFACISVVFHKAQYLALDVVTDGFYSSCMVYLCVMSILNYRSNACKSHGGGIQSSDGLRSKHIMLSTLPWLLSLAVTSPSLYGWGVPFISINKTWTCSSLSHTLTRVTVIYLGPVLVKGFCTLKLFTLLKNYDKSATDATDANRKLHIRARKARVSLIKRDALFFICCTPLASHHVAVCISSNDDVVLHSLCTLCAVFYVFIVPILHGGILDKNFRARLRKGVEKNRKRVVKVTSRAFGRRQRMDLTPVNAGDIHSAEMILERPPVLYHKKGLPYGSAVEHLHAAKHRHKETALSTNANKRSDLRNDTASVRKRVGFGQEWNDKEHRKKYCSTPSLKHMRKIQNTLGPSFVRDMEPVTHAQKGSVKRELSRRARVRHLLSIRHRSRLQNKRCVSMHRHEKHGKKITSIIDRRCSQEGHDAICKPKVK